MADDKPKALTDAGLQTLLQQLPGWAVDDGQLAKEFRFKGFSDAVSFIHRLVPYFDATDHHPDIHVFYSRVKFELSRHDIGRKITALDGEVAKHIEHEFSRLKG